MSSENHVHNYCSIREKKKLKITTLAILHVICQYHVPSSIFRTEILAFSQGYQLYRNLRVKMPHMGHRCTTRHHILSKFNRPRCTSENDMFGDRVAYLHATKDRPPATRRSEIYSNADTNNVKTLVGRVQRVVFLVGKYRPEFSQLD